MFANPRYLLLFVECPADVDISAQVPTLWLDSPTQLVVFQSLIYRCIRDILLFKYQIGLIVQWVEYDIAPLKSMVRAPHQFSILYKVNSSTPFIFFDSSTIKTAHDDKFWCKALSQPHSMQAALTSLVRHRIPC